MKQSVRKWMSGRYGADQLAVFTLILGLVLSILGSIFRSGLIEFLGLVLYLWTVFRMFSRNTEARRKENRKFLETTGQWKRKAQQFMRRMKNRKEYKYFKCPQCRQLLRLKRGCGEKTVTCAKCGHQFQKKA